MISTSPIGRHVLQKLDVDMKDHRVISFSS